MGPSSSHLPAELYGRVMWISTFTGVPSEMGLFVTAISLSSLVQMFFYDSVYLFLERGGEREKEKERNITV